MFKRSLWIALGLVALVVFFTVMPTGTSASDVPDGYQNTLSLTRSGTLPYQFMDVIEAKDPLLVEVENKAGSMADHIWLYNGEPVPFDYTKQNDSFPYRRLRDYNGSHDDYVGLSYWDYRNNQWIHKPNGIYRFHSGTDLGTLDPYRSGELVHVALWGGEVVEVKSDSARGNYITISHGSCFYTRYQHLADGSIKVKVGDKVDAGDPIGSMGSTGNSTGRHAHVELFLAPEGLSGNFFYGGIANIIWSGKSLSEISWYASKGKEALDLSEVPGMDSVEALPS